MAFALMPYCIANARPDEGCTVDLNPDILAVVFGEPKERVENAIQYLCSPDMYSRSKDCGGRRLVHVGPGPFRYKVVNLEKYRNDAASGERREYWRQYRAWQRDGKKGRFKLCSQPVQPCSQNVHATDADAETDARADADTKKRPKPLSNPVHTAFIKQWCENFRASHGFDYSFDGGRDGAAVKRLTGKGIHLTDLHEIAKDAWTRNKRDGEWNCKQAITIHGFNNYFNQIRAVVRSSNGAPIQNGNF